MLSPADVLADHETWDVGKPCLTEAKTEEMLQHEYAREALKNGLLVESGHGSNPYIFGLVGSTDGHSALPTVETDDFFGAWDCTAGDLDSRQPVFRGYEKRRLFQNNILLTH